MYYTQWTDHDAAYGNRLQTYMHPILHEYVDVTNSSVHRRIHFNGETHKWK